MLMKPSRGHLLALVPATVLATPTLDTTGLQRELAAWAGDRPGVIVALALDGEARGWASAGRWSVDEDRPADLHTAFEIGSITKVFTALLGAEAAADGRLDWHAPVDGGFAPSAITPAQLATHTSGLPALPVDFPARDLVDPYAELDLADLRAGFAATLGTVPPPPAAWSYSNLGAAVLGQAIAAGLGGDYAALVRERLLAPLGMTQTWWSRPGSVTPDTMAPGFTPDGPAARWHFDAYAPAGALVSTAADLEKFLRHVLTRPERWAPTMAVRAPTGGPDAMGYGWFIREVNGAPVYWHGGGTGGYRTFVGAQPATGRAIVVLGARDRDVSGIGIGWLQGLFTADDAPSADTGADVDAAPLKIADFVGDYPLAPQFVLRVFADGDGLQVQATAQPAFALRPQGADTFALEGVPARIVFDRNPGGEVTGLVLHQAGREMPAPRHPAGSLDSDRKGVRLTAAQLTGLAGDYELAPGVVMTISRAGDQVFARLTGQPTLPIFAAGPDDFFYDAVEAQIRFERNADGEVTGLVLHQGGQAMPAPKR